MKTTEKTIYQGWAFRLIVINVMVFVIQLIADKYKITYDIQGMERQGPSAMTFYLGLMPALVAGKGYVWQVFSYMFLHDISNILHIFFNMYALLIFGIPVENAWGSRKFLTYYLFCGTFAGITIFLINYFSQGLGYFIPTIGASGAIFGLLLAFGLLYPDAELLMFFILPIKAKYLVFIYGGLELFFELRGGTGNVSHLGHLGGLAGGILFFLVMNRRSLKFKFKIKKASIKKNTFRDHSVEHGIQQKVNINDTDRQLEILKKLKEGGHESLSDDDIQYIKYIEIMSQDADHSLCSEVDYNTDDLHCKKCENFKSCFSREVKKYL
jgi:membrane associated rhomboid family serine protease